MPLEWAIAHCRLDLLAQGLLRCHGYVDFQHQPLVSRCTSWLIPVECDERNLVYDCPHSARICRLFRSLHQDADLAMCWVAQGAEGCLPLPRALFQFS